MWRRRANQKLWILSWLEKVDRVGQGPSSDSENGHQSDGQLWLDSPKSVADMD